MSSALDNLPSPSLSSKSNSSPQHTSIWSSFGMVCLAVANVERRYETGIHSQISPKCEFFVQICFSFIFLLFPFHNLSSFPPKSESQKLQNSYVEAASCLLLCFNGTVFLEPLWTTLIFRIHIIFRRKGRRIVLCGAQLALRTVWGTIGRGLCYCAAMQCAHCPLHTALCTMHDVLCTTAHKKEHVCLPL